MPESPFQDLDEQYGDMIEIMEDRFTIHQFILPLFQKHHDEFIDALKHYYVAYPANTAPVRPVTNQLPQKLNKLPMLVKHLGELGSPDILRDPLQCTFWQKIP